MAKMFTRTRVIVSFILILHLLFIEQFSCSTLIRPPFSSKDYTVANFC